MVLALKSLNTVAFGCQITSSKTQLFRKRKRGFGCDLCVLHVRPVSSVPGGVVCCLSVTDGSGANAQLVPIKQQPTDIIHESCGTGRRRSKPDLIKDKANIKLHPAGHVECAAAHTYLAYETLITLIDTIKKRPRCLYSHTRCLCCHCASKPSPTAVSVLLER